MELELIKCQDAYWRIDTFGNGMWKTEDGVVSCTIDIRVPVTFKEEDIHQYV